jgi:hypothetical protein
MGGQDPGIASSVGVGCPGVRQSSTLPPLCQAITRHASGPGRQASAVPQSQLTQAQTPHES